MNGTMSMADNFKNAFKFPKNTFEVDVPKLPDIGISGAASAFSAISSYIKAPTIDNEVINRPTAQQWADMHSVNSANLCWRSPFPAQ